MVRKSLTGVALLTAGAGALAAYVFAVRPWHLRWGTTAAEAEESLPGDEFVPHPKGVATHAVTIQAPAAEVWPWLAQIGQDKGGFYSYTWLENLVGCHMRNADRVVPEFQQIKAGDGVRLHPKVGPLPVLICEPYRALVLGSNTENPGTWGFFLKKVNEDTTRLIVRGRGAWRPSLFNWLYQHLLFEPAHFVMERKMMLGIKRRAEGAAQPTASVHAKVRRAGAAGEGGGERRREGDEGAEGV